MKSALTGSRSFTIRTIGMDSIQLLPHCTQSASVALNTTFSYLIRTRRVWNKNTALTGHAKGIAAPRTIVSASAIRSVPLCVLRRGAALVDSPQWAPSRSEGPSIA